MTDNAESWSRYWRSESKQGEVFVDPSGEKHPALTEFWERALASVQAGERIVDIAAGAGSILACLAGVERVEKLACDLSGDALARLRERLPDVATSVCDATALPYDDQSMDWVVSQFGLEYAGGAAFDEAVRIVAPGGRFVALCHYRDGIIDRNHQKQLAAAAMLKDEQFIAKATALIRAAFVNDEAKFNVTAEAFIPAERKLAAAVSDMQVGVHAHLYIGFRQLYERRRQYNVEDITGWLDAMAGEVDNSIERLQAITAVALTEDEVAAIGRRCIDSGLDWQSPAKFYGSDQELPVAWHLAAARPPTR
ncbi:MAG: class I SAM-dependent methyltransferase [Pseudomonadota bacterium]